jgi:hypothetical protein
MAIEPSLILELMVAKEFFTLICIFLVVVR